MQKSHLFFLGIVFLSGTFAKTNNSLLIDELQNGDIIFHTSKSHQSRAIQLATHSKYSHCGIIYKEGNKAFVFEAVQPVKKTPLHQWISQGKSNHYVIKRLKNADTLLTASVKKKMKKIAVSFIGKNYDLAFNWSDKEIYCSELIWKIYKRAVGVDVGKLAKMKDFDLSHPIVKKKMRSRYGKTIPMNQTVISPKAIFDSNLLETIKTN